MRMIQVPLRFAAVLSAALLLSPRADAQIPPVQLNQSASSAANATQRVRLQVQQRVQAQTQQRIQAQAQQRIQSQTQLRLAGNSSVRIGADVSANARVNAGTQAKAGSNSQGSENSQNAGGAIGVGIPVTLTAEDMANLDVVFGEFNPFQRPDRDETSTEGESASNAQNDSDAGPSDEPDSEQPRGKRPVRLVFQSEAELQASLTAAVRQRRAEISSMRDQALAEADAKKMAFADRMETMMDAYVAAEAKANANANSAINTNPFSRNPDSTIIKTGAEGEAQGRGKAVVPGRRPAPEDNNTSPE